VLRGLWLTRNDFVFNKHVWLDVKIVLKRILRLRVEWEPIFKESKLEEKNGWSSFLEKLIQEGYEATEVIAKKSAPGLLEDSVSIKG
jgi:hypothetical protein